MAVPFDAARREITGTSVPMVSGIRTGAATGIAQYSVSDSGTLAYIAGPSASAHQRLIALGPDGAVTPLTLPSASFESPRVSPDGQWLAYDTDDGTDASVWIYNLSGGTVPRKLPVPGRSRVPIWSADSKYIVLQSDRGGSVGIWRVRADGSGVPEQLTRPSAGTSHMPDSWIGKTNQFTFSAITGDVATLWTYSIDGHKATELPGIRSNSPLQSSVSFDGHWLAYGVRRPGNATVYVDAFPPTGSPREVPVQGAHHAMWSPDGSALYLFPLGGALVSVPIEKMPSVEFGAPRPVPGAFQANTSPASARNHDITPDGKRFITVDDGQLEASHAESPSISVVLNWFEELKRLAPPK